MGTWGSGPLDNDAAADFLEAAQAGVARVVAKTLRGIARAPAGRLLDDDDGGAGWAACELVAIAFGHGDPDAASGAPAEVAARLAAKEELRLLAIEALARIGDQATSEVAKLWHEGDDGAAFDARIAGLKARLAAAAGGRASPAAKDTAKDATKKGDVFAIPTAPGAAEVFVVQMVGPREVAVFDGIWRDDTAALEAVDSLPARRVSTDAGKLPSRGRRLANRPVRKDLRGPKLYATETGSLEAYALSSANGRGGLRIVSYEEARDHDLLWGHNEKALLAVARGAQPVQRVRSVDEREAELLARRGAEWAARREATTPGPCGDVPQLAKHLDWIDSYGVENLVAVSHRIATGMQGYGRPAEDAERLDYAFAALVAIWRGTLPRDEWPAELRARLPPPPSDRVLAEALAAARVLAAKVLTRDAELRLIWHGGPDGGAALRRWVDRLQRALA